MKPSCLSMLRKLPHFSLNSRAIRAESKHTIKLISSRRLKGQSRKCSARETSSSPYLNRMKSIQDQGLRTNQGSAKRRCRERGSRVSWIRRLVAKKKARLQSRSHGQLLPKYRRFLRFKRSKKSRMNHIFRWKVCYKIHNNVKVRCHGTSLRWIRAHTNAASQCHSSVSAWASQPACATTRGLFCNTAAARVSSLAMIIM